MLADEPIYTACLKHNQFIDAYNANKLIAINGQESRNYRGKGWFIPTYPFVDRYKSQEYISGLPTISSMFHL